MSDPDWEELFSQPGLRDMPEIFHNIFLDRMTATPPKTEKTPYVPAGFLTTAPRSPRPKPSTSKTGDNK